MEGVLRLEIPQKKQSTFHQNQVLSKGTEELSTRKVLYVRFPYLLVLYLNGNILFQKYWQML